MFFGSFGAKKRQKHSKNTLWGNPRQLSKSTQKALRGALSGPGPGALLSMAAGIAKFDPHTFPQQSRKIVYVYWFFVTFCLPKEARLAPLLNPTSLRKVYVGPFLRSLHDSNFPSPENLCKLNSENFRTAQLHRIDNSEHVFPS